MDLNSETEVSVLMSCETPRPKRRVTSLRLLALDAFLKSDEDEFDELDKETKARAAEIEILKQEVTELENLVIRRLECQVKLTKRLERISKRVDAFPLPGEFPGY